MDYLVELQGGWQDKVLSVRVEARSMEEAVEKAEDLWGYNAISVGVTPTAPGPAGHSSHAEDKYAVNSPKPINRIGERL